MASEIETIYYLENPERKIIKFATGYQLRYDDIIKDVFGVACLKDLPMMIKYNRSFQESLCQSKGVKESQISMEMVVHVASKHELLQLRNQLLLAQNQNGASCEESITCPFDSIIRLKEGIFKWDTNNSTYNLING
ncbi:hypothetical protein HHO41_06020 [Bacillus sp. DNRA2]|uniref:hypothetical protein n=1 Tax=Bacillus sp. DNRA2 TaxID=2723053 RepID=UPI00145FC295|nr:hypothetical protein [Bacillus sp. DNRA2]NMD69838.1 hypothetical protein [Bacillus sp. DNRA2]